MYIHCRAYLLNSGSVFTGESKTIFSGENPTSMPCKTSPIEAHSMPCPWTEDNKIITDCQGWKVPHDFHSPHWDKPFTYTIWPFGWFELPPPNSCVNRENKQFWFSKILSNLPCNVMSSRICKGVSSHRSAKKLHGRGVEVQCVGPGCKTDECGRKCARYIGHLQKVLPIVVEQQGRLLGINFIFNPKQTSCVSAKIHVTDIFSGLTVHSSFTHITVKRSERKQKQGV